MLRILRTLALTLGIVAVAISDLGEGRAAGGPAEPCVQESFEGSGYVICTIDLLQWDLRLYWADDDGRPYRTFSALTSTEEGAELAFAMNAGMYDHAQAPIGLYVEDGTMISGANTADGPGNFHLKPNGVFYIEGETAGVMETGQFLTTSPDVDHATQSGPMLLIDGEIHHRFLPESTSRKRRNGVGIQDAHTVVFAITEGRVTFWEFARLFRDHLGVENALFLDGSMSSLFAPNLDRMDALRAMGPMIGASPR